MTDRSRCARRSSCWAAPTRCTRRSREAEILDSGAGVRPAFADNVPKIVVRGRTLHVNGLYRHGFLLAPVLAELVAQHLEGGATDARVFIHQTP